MGSRAGGEVNDPTRFPGVVSGRHAGKGLTQSAPRLFAGSLYHARLMMEPVVASHVPLAVRETWLSGPAKFMLLRAAVNRNVSVRLVLDTLVAAVLRMLSGGPIVDEANSPVKKIGPVFPAPTAITLGVPASVNIPMKGAPGTVRSVAVSISRMGVAFALPAETNASAMAAAPQSTELRHVMVTPSAMSADIGKMVKDKERRQCVGVMLLRSPSPEIDKCH